MKRARITAVVILFVGFAGCLAAGCTDQGKYPTDIPYLLPDYACQCDVSTADAAAPFTGAFKLEDRQEFSSDLNYDGNPDTLYFIDFLCLQQVGSSVTGTLEDIYYQDDYLRIYSKYYGITAGISPSGQEAMFHENLIWTEDGAKRTWHEQIGTLNESGTTLQLCRTDPNGYEHCNDYIRQ